MYDLEQVGFHTAAQIDVRGIETLIGATGYTGEYGYELFFPEEKAVAMWEMLLEAGAPEGLLAMRSGGPRLPAFRSLPAPVRPRDHR